MIRKYEGSDYDTLKEMLLAEGLKEEEMSFDTDTTYIVDNSFFTLRWEHGFMSLVHFCVDHKHRSQKSARDLLKGIKEVVVGKLIIHSKKEYLNKCIEYYYKTKPYKVEDGCNFYLVEVT